MRTGPRNLMKTPTISEDIAKIRSDFTRAEKNNCLDERMVYQALVDIFDCLDKLSRKMEKIGVKY